MKIKMMRERAGMTQQELAKKVGLRYSSTICMYESGQRKLNADRVPAFARALGCSIEELYGEEIADLLDAAPSEGSAGQGGVSLCPERTEVK